MIITGPFRAPGAAGGAARPDSVTESAQSSWLLEAKVLAPPLPAWHVSRGSVLRYLDGLLERRLTVLRAPAGFGKTTALAEVVHDRKERGVVAGWISLDADDVPNLFGSYLAYSFERAGLEPGGRGPRGAWAPSDAVRQMGMLARAIGRHEAPCLLVLDEVDNLPPRTVRLVELLILRAPRNLHIALTYRTNPGIELTTFVLDGRAIVLGPEALRFSTADIARLFDESLRQGELAAIEKRTAGWPVALVVHRNARGAQFGSLDADGAHLSEDYIGMRLLRDLSPEERDGLCDLAVFDRVDADLVDEVLGSSDTRLRVDSLSSLDGLLPSVDTQGTVRRLHPLVRDYCLKQLAIRNPDRKRSLHKLIALELARRGQLAPAWRHARAAGGGELVGELIERHGACRLWLREGVTRLIDADRFLTPAIRARYPRLDLLHCVRLCLASKHGEAAARLEAVSERTDGFVRDRDGGDPEALAVDGVFARSAVLRSCQQLRPGDFAPFQAGDPAGVVFDERSRMLACARHALLCVASYERANLDESRRHGLQARKHLAVDMRFGDVFLDVCLGMSAMAQGRVREARERYRRARGAAREFFSTDPCIASSTEVLMIELDLEQNRERAIRQRLLKNLAALRGIWPEIQATAVGMRAELMLGRYDGRAVVGLLSRAVDDARESGALNLPHHMSALLAYFLVELGRSDEAARVWRDERLPCDAAELLDLDRQPWRVMEALACARIRLLGEQAEYDAAGDLAGGLCAVSAERGLTRTLLRGLALSMVVAHRAGQRDRALEHLTAFLRAARGVGYTRPLVRHREVSRAVLERLIATDPGEELRTDAESLLASLGEPDTGDRGFFSEREIEVLAEAAQGRRTREIAARLGITGPGVRYHLKNIYRKAGVGRREDAVRYARSLGVLS